MCTNLHQLRGLLVASALAATAACGDPPIGPGDDDRDIRPFASCDLDITRMIAASARDGIPSLDDPVWARADRGVPDYLDPDTRVVGVFANGIAYAVPLNVMWNHEIVNFETGGPNAPSLAVTYCPLTGSSLVFDRASVGGATLGVSGVLFMNNLLVYDRRDPEDTLWPQMLAKARCGTRRGATLARFPHVEIEWADWLALHPGTFVVADVLDQGLSPIQFDYTSVGYPYGAYLEREQFFNDQIMPPPDRRRFAKERVIGVPGPVDESGGEGGIAFPFDALADEPGSAQAVSFQHGSEPAVLLWSDDARGGGAFRPVTESGTDVTLSVTGGTFTDDETGSVWSVEGRALAGPLEGERLLAVAEAYTAFWGAWVAFHPETELWTG